MRIKILQAAPGLGLCVAALVVATSPVAAQTTGQTSSGWTPGPGAAAGDTYDGFIDSPTSGASIPSSGAFDVNGWFVDTTAQGWAGADQVQVYLGQMGSGGTMLAQGVVAETRPDVAAALNNPFDANSGFMVQVPAASVPAGTQTLDVYLHTPGKGWWYEPVTVDVGAGGAAAPAAAAAPAPAAAPAAAATGTATGLPQVTISDPSENQTISTKVGSFIIDGNATEPGIGPSDIDQVSVYIDGEQDTGTLIGTTTPGSDGSWSMSFIPTHYASTHSNIYVYAHSKSTGKVTETVRGFNITDSN